MRAPEHALLDIRGASENHEIVIERPEELDILTLRLEPSKQIYESVGGNVSMLQSLVKDLEEHAKSIFGVKPTDELVAYGELSRFKGKAKRVRDLTKNG